ncbi:site-2 protease family protein [Candidatus Roizmanbacteria bacterium]|nr:site-2 protease family protein [Candidatus Roizmanbacteria bacterium]
MTIIIFILTLALLVLVHEFGHFLAAKRQGVKVEEFGFGLPPRLFGIKIGETLYSINLLPIGGFVKLYGEEYHEIKNKNLSKRAFINKNSWQKALIIVAGVLGNLILGWALISYLFTQGVPVPSNKVTVEKVIKNSPAEKAGFKERDVVLTFYAQAVQSSPTKLKNSEDLIALSKKYAGQQIKITILRSGKQIPVVITPRKNPPVGEGPIGVIITSFEEKKFPWYQAPFYGLIEASKITYKIAVELLKVLVQIASFQRPQVDVAGPVGIAQYAQTAIKFGKNAYLELIALLSFNLAIINILPFPALDGGRLMFVIYEAVTKKRLNKNVEKYANLIGILILLSLAVVITINDIIKIYR